MKQEINKITVLTLLAVGLYLLGVFNEISIYSLLVIIPLSITYIIIITRMIILTRKKS